MNKKLNNKGFTLVELLAVLAILIAIMAIAIPSISSSLERTKAKQNASRERVIESAAELYVADHKNAIYNNLGSNDSCYISIGDINYLTDEELKDADGKPINGYVIFKKPNTYEYSTTNNSLNPCDINTNVSDDNDTNNNVDNNKEETVTNGEYTSNYKYVCAEYNNTPSVYGGFKYDPIFQTSDECPAVFKIQSCEGECNGSNYIGIGYEIRINDNGNCVQESFSNSTIKFSIPITNSGPYWLYDGGMTPDYEKCAYKLSGNYVVSIS